MSGPKPEHRSLSETNLPVSSALFQKRTYAPNRQFLKLASGAARVSHRPFVSDFHRRSGGLAMPALLKAMSRRPCRCSSAHGDLPAQVNLAGILHAAVLRARPEQY